MCPNTHLSPAASTKQKIEDRAFNIDKYVIDKFVDMQGEELNHFLSKNGLAILPTTICGSRYEIYHELVSFDTVTGKT